MKISLFTRLAGLVLAVGFFYSCGSTVNIDELVENNQYTQALNQLDEMIEKEADRPDLYLQRAEISALAAQEVEPEERAQFYVDATNDFDSADQYGATDSQKSTIDSLRQQYWKDEHNAGLQSSKKETAEYERAATHFSNAIILRVDAISSYQNLAIAQFNEGKIEEAIESLLSALNHTEEPPASIYENLGYLHLEKGDAKEATHYYELANKNLEEDLNVTFGLVNAYIAAGNSEQAVKLLEPLIENNPQNANLRNVFGTQLYNITAEIVDDLKSAYKNNDSILVDQIKIEAEGMGEQAETQLVEAYKRDTLNTEYLESLAVFYNNLAGQYFSLLDVAFENDKEELNNKALSLINFSIEYYSKLVETEPNNQEYNAKLNGLKNLKQNRTIPY